MLSRQIEAVSASASPKQKRQLFQTLSILAAVFGIFVRLVQYLSRRSLWEDEANLALNIVNRSYLELLQPLDYNQAAPPLFLWIEKAAVQLLGNNEYALRLFPFLCGIVGVVGFHRLASRYCVAAAVPVAVVLFACLRYVLYYANEVKQYSSDVMVAVLLCLLLIPLRHQSLSQQKLIGLGLLGAGFIWLSHPTIFVLAGIEISYFLIATNSQRRLILINRLPMYLTWLLGFASLYWITIRGTLGNETLASSWGDRYPRSPLDIVWLFDAFGRFFYNPLGFLSITDGIAIVAFAIGCVALYRRNRVTLLVFCAPILVTLFAACLKQYPFRERLVLFLAPLAILIIAEGIAFLYTQPRRWHIPALVSGAFLLAALVVPPLIRASNLVVHPTQKEEIRPVMAYIQSHQQADDKLYVYQSGQNQFIYYAPIFGYLPHQYVLGESAMANAESKKPRILEPGVKQFKREIRQLKESRVWFLFCRALSIEEQAFLSTIEPFGQQLDKVQQTGASAYLYQLKQKAS